MKHRKEVRDYWEGGSVSGWDHHEFLVRAGSGMSDLDFSVAYGFTRGGRLKRNEDSRQHLDTGWNRHSDAEGEYLNTPIAEPKH